MPDSTSTAEKNDLAQIADRLRQGDRSVLAEIWNRYGQELRRRARNRLRQYGMSGQTESMDICNAVLLDLINKQNVEIRNPAELVSYMQRAIDNQVRDVIKSLKRLCRDIQRVDARSVEEHTILGEQTTPSACLAREEVFERVRAELGDAGDRFLAMVLSGHSWLEIGEVFGVSPDTARMRWSRVVEKVRVDFGVAGDEW